MNIVTEVLQSQVLCHVFHYNGLVAALFLLDEEEEQPFSQIVDLLDVARQTVMRYLDCPLSAGVSNACFQLGQVHRAAEQAQSALDQSVLLNESQVLTIADVEPGSTHQLAADDMALRTFSNLIKMGKTEEAEDQVHRLLEEVRSSKASYHEYQVYLLEVLMVLIRTARDLDVDWPTQSGGSGRILETILQCREPEEAEAFLCSLCRQLAGCVRDTRVESGQKLSRAACEYLLANFGSSDVSLEKVCRHLAYQRSLFQYTVQAGNEKDFSSIPNGTAHGQGYDTTCRKRFKNGGYRIDGGHGEPSYFSYSFKKHFGISPSQARKSGKEARS